jgi:hypothetical protein
MKRLTGPARVHDCLKNALLPIVLGITGHRDLRPEDLPPLKERLRELFRDLRREYPHTPLQLLSPLAEGADRLAARIGLEFEIELVVPLPMPREEYAQDFKTPESKAEFNELMEKAAVGFELPWAEGTTLAMIQNDRSSRDRQYAEVGKYVAAQSQILIALWDGVFKETVGGTSNIVRFKLGDPKLQNPSERILDPVDSGPVYHIVTPRLETPLPAKYERFSIHKHFPGSVSNDAEMDGAYRRILKRTDDFNRDALRLGAKNPNLIDRSRNYLMDPEAAAGLSLSCQAIFERYATADALAIQFQKKRKRTMIGLFILVGLAVICMENYDGWLENWEPVRSFLWIYLGALGLAFLWHRLAGRREYQSKHLEYRALAEGLRVQFFWRLAGLNEIVSEHYLRKQRSGLEWIRNAIRGCRIPSGNIDAVAANDRKCNYCLVLRYWVNSQKKYHAATVQRDEKKNRRLERRMRALIIFGMILACVVAGIDIWFARDIEPRDHIHKVMRILMQIAPALGAAFGGYAMKMALVEQVKRYRRMGVLYERASECLDELIKKEDFESAEQLLRELGNEALIESADWLFLHQERPMEVPLGG